MNFLLLAGCSYAPTHDDLAVDSPRSGRVLYPPTTQSDAMVNGVAIVYSHQEDINLKLAWEEFTSDDPHKARKLYQQLVADGAIKPADVFVPGEADDDALLAVHDRAYLDSLNSRKAVAQIVGAGFPEWQSGYDHRHRMLAGHRTAVGGTMLAAELAAAHGLAIHLGGGFTHAFVDRGSRGHLFADVPVAMKMLRQRKLAQRIMVVDLGALQANGVASILAGDKDAYLLDIYEKNNYPPTKQPEPNGIAIADGLGDGDYRLKLDNALTKALDEFKPQFVFYIAGVDVVRGDPVGRSAMTLGGITDRDLFVAQQVRSRRIPMCIVLGGGGAEDSWAIHYRTIRGLLARYAGVPFRKG
ncbi:MAG: histone deacetylase [Phycisphaerae bacterium]|nr:histone deacetylase [Phycisphaerae bacterium]